MSSYPLVEEFIATKNSIVALLKTYNFPLENRPRPKRKVNLGSVGTRISVYSISSTKRQKRCHIVETKITIPTTKHAIEFQPTNIAIAMQALAFPPIWPTHSSACIKTFDANLVEDHIQKTGWTQLGNDFVFRFPFVLTPGLSVGSSKIFCRPWRHHLVAACRIALTSEEAEWIGGWCPRLTDGSSWVFRTYRHIRGVLLLSYWRVGKSIKGSLNYKSYKSERKIHLENEVKIPISHCVQSQKKLSHKLNLSPIDFWGNSQYWSWLLF